MKVNVSINDFAPLLKGPEFLFRGLKEADADGIELGLGFKSRWSSARYVALAEQYDLKIVSLHQPLWSGLGLVFDEGAFYAAKAMDVKYMVCHPLPRASWHNKRMRRYLGRLTEIQEKSGVKVFLENMPPQYDNVLLGRLFPVDSQTGDVLALHKVAKEFGLGIALDTDHVRSNDLHKERWLETVLPLVGAVHLSSFDKQRQHLPLDKGDFNATEFIRYLRDANYSGLLTLEVNYPKAITWSDYDFSAIRKSVSLVKGTES